MNESGGIIGGNWLWGGIWVFYAYFYGKYFIHVANGLKPELKTVAVQGSPARLVRKALWCNRFALFIAIPTVLEFIRSTYFTSVVISLAPCFFGLWVMRSIWVEVFCSKAAKLKPSDLKSSSEEAESHSPEQH